MLTKCIFTPFVARNLLKMGNPIIDIKPDKNNKDKTIFVFENTDKLKEDMVKATQHWPYLYLYAKERTKNGT